jgi:predicted ATP-grasp superfamily ATP-dependent carboligase
VKSPVLVIGWIPRIVVAIARSLHAHGVPVDVANWATGYPIHSRAIREFVPLPNPETAPTDFVGVLRSFIKKRAHDMVIPADDQALTSVVEHYDDLKDLAHVTCPPPSITRLVLNKACTLELAEKHGIRVPKSILISHSREFDPLVNTLPFPWIVKPAEKEQHEEEFKTFKLASADELRKRFPAPRAFRPSILLQEFCEGVGVGIEMLIEKGECRAVFQHRRLKELPYSGGVAVVAISERPDPALIESSLTLLRALQWDGVAMVEFKVNPADGSAVLMEVNGRYWGTIGLPILAGLDFPLLHWKVVHGEPVNASGVCTVGIKWRWTMGYVARLHGLLTAAPRSTTARQALCDNLLHFSGDFGRGIHDPMLKLSDPRLVLTESLRTTGYLFASTLGALRRRLFPSLHTG